MNQAHKNILCFQALATNNQINEKYTVKGIV